MDSVRIDLHGTNNEEERSKYTKLEEAWRYYNDVLKSPRNVVAPMVDASELAWRLLSRRYNSDLCFTPMLHSRIFVEDAKYRSEHLFQDISPEDRPLIVQFCGNDPDVIVQACRIAIPYCDGVDINLGCPQKIAKNGRYGAFLMDDLDNVFNIVSTIRRSLNIPVSCKIRIFPELAQTISYAKMLEKAGCFMLTVHGRTRDQKGPKTGLADWSVIEEVKKAVKVPVLANGNIQFLEDVDNCIKKTGVNGVMTAEGNLHNPQIFAGKNPPVWDAGLEYLELLSKHPCPIGYSRGHLFKLYHHVLSLPENAEIRERLARCSTVKEMTDCTIIIKNKYAKYVENPAKYPWEQVVDSPFSKKFPPFICQPYVRPAPELAKDSAGVDGISQSKVALKNKKHELFQKYKSLLPETDLEHISTKKLKRIAKNPGKNWMVQRVCFEICRSCPSPKSLKCEFSLCKNCCKEVFYEKDRECRGHKLVLNLTSRTAVSTPYLSP